MAIRWSSWYAQTYSILSEYQAEYPAILDIATSLSLNKLLDASEKRRHFIYTDVYASGSVPGGWVPTRGGTVKYSVRNPVVYRYLRQLLPGRWQKVIKQSNSG